MTPILRRFWNFLVEASRGSRGRNGGRGRVLPPLPPLLPLPPLPPLPPLLIRIDWGFGGGTYPIKIVGYV